MVVEFQAERIRYLPLEVQTERIVFLDGVITAMAESIVTTRLGHLGPDAALVNGAANRCAAARAAREPDTETNGVLAELGFRVGVVQRGDKVIRGGPLQGDLCIGPLALVLSPAVTHVLRIPVAAVRALVVVLHASVVSGVTVFEPLCHVGFFLTVVPLGVRTGNGDTKRVVGKRVAVNAGNFRRPLIQAFRVCRRGLVMGLRGSNSPEARVVERPRGHDIDRGADATRGQACPWGLVDFYGGNALGGDIEEVKRPTAGCRHLTAVQRGEVEPGSEASHGDLRAFAVETVNRHARNPLQRFGEVGVREFADILGRDGVEQAAGVALAIHGIDQAAAYAGNQNFLHQHGVVVVGVGICVLCHGGLNAHRAQCQGDT